MEQVEWYVIQRKPEHFSYFVLSEKSNKFFLFYFNEIGAVEGGISHDEFIDNVASDILNKVPKLFEVWRIKKALQMNLTPTGVVLLQELDRFNLLLERLEKTLVLLRKVRFKYNKCVEKSMYLMDLRLS